MKAMRWANVTCVQSFKPCRPAQADEIEQQGGVSFLGLRRATPLVPQIGQKIFNQILHGGTGLKARMLI